jgi:hypothetical protein
LNKFLVLLALAAQVGCVGQMQPFPGPSWHQSSPQITSLSENTGFVSDSVHVNGINFGTSVGTVTVSGTTATITGWTATQVTITIPDVVSGNVILTSSTGRASNAVAFGTIPNITSLSSSSGYIAGSTVASGTAFGTGGSVTVGGANASFGSRTMTSVSITIPATLAAGSQNVIVYQGVGVDGSAPYSYTVSSPVINSVSPGSGHCGSSATLGGEGFGNGLTSLSVSFSGITFGTVPATISSHTSTSIVVTVPGGFTGSGLSASVVVTANGSQSNNGSYTVTCP